MKNNQGVSILMILIVLAILGFLVIQNWDSINEITSRDNPKDRAQEKIQQVEEKLEKTQEKMKKRLEKGLEESQP